MVLTQTERDVMINMLLGQSNEEILQMLEKEIQYVDRNINYLILCKEESNMISAQKKRYVILHGLLEKFTRGF